MQVREALIATVRLRGVGVSGSASTTIDDVSPGCGVAEYSDFHQKAWRMYMFCGRRDQAEMWTTPALNAIVT